MSVFHSEQYLSNELVFSTLKNISKEQAIAYSKLKKFFSEGDEEIARAFWIMLRKKLPNQNITQCTFVLLAKSLI